MENILNLIDSNTKESLNYKKVETWYDGTTMNNANVDGVVYRKKGNTYYRLVGSEKSLKTSLVNNVSPFKKACEIVDSVKDIKSIIIDRDYDLTGETITIPENIILDFQGGSLSNGDLNISNDVKIKGDPKLVGIESVGTVVSNEYLTKDTMEEMRGLSNLEIFLLKVGYYKGVKLNGYYQKGDTPEPIEYYLSDTAEVDDGGSVFEVGGIKLEHNFNERKEFAHISYFGIKETISTEDVDTLNKFSKVVYEGDFETDDMLIIRSKELVLNTSIEINTESGGVHFIGVNSFEIKKFNIDGKGVCRRGVQFTDVQTVFNGRNNSLIKNIGNENITTEVTAIMIRGGCHNFILENIYIKDVIAQSVSNGVYLGLVSAGHEKPKNVIIRNNTIDTVLPGSDADGIKYLDVNGDDKNFLVENNIFIDCAKRAMKFQTTGCHSRNNTIIHKKRQGSYAFIDWQGNVGSSINDTVELFPDEFETLSNFMYYIALRIGGSDINVENFNTVVHKDLNDLEGLDQNIRMISITPVSSVDYSEIKNINIINCNFVGQYIDMQGDISNLNIRNCQYFPTGGLLFRTVPGSTSSVKNFYISLVNMADDGGGTPEVGTNMTSGVFKYKAVTNSIYHAIIPTNRDSVDYYVSVGKGEVQNNPQNFTIVNNVLTAKMDTLTTSPQIQTQTKYRAYNGAMAGDFTYSRTPQKTAYGLLIGYICTEDSSVGYPKGQWEKVYAGTNEISQIQASADTATQAAGATPTKEEFDALLAELRDLKAKMRTAGLLES